MFDGIKCRLLQRSVIYGLYNHFSLTGPSSVMIFAIATSANLHLAGWNTSGSVDCDPLLIWALLHKNYFLLENYWIIPTEGISRSGYFRVDDGVSQSLR